MKILFIANRFPYPPYRGDKLKIYNLAKRLSVKHELFLLTFAQEKSDYQHVPELKKFFREVRVVFLPKYISVLKCLVNVFSSRPYQIIYFSSNKFRTALKEFLAENKTDVIHTQHLRMSQYVSNLQEHKRILDLPDAYSLYWERRAASRSNLFKKLFHKIEYQKVMKYEEIIKKFDLNLVCSEEDKLFLMKKHNVDNVEILPNGVDLEFFKSGLTKPTQKPRIIFTGNMDYFPNIDAVEYFVRDIFPIILTKQPSAEFYIVGQKPVSRVLALQSANVFVTGFVKDLNNEYIKSAVAISPIRFGAGTLNKVLEPMAMGIPVVCTKVGFQGLGVRSGDGVVLAENTESFAEEVLSLLGDENYRKDVGEKGRKVIYDKFDWDKITLTLESFFERVIAGS